MLILNISFPFLFWLCSLIFLFFVTLFFYFLSFVTVLLFFCLLGLCSFIFLSLGTLFFYFFVFCNCSSIFLSFVTLLWRLCAGGAPCCWSWTLRWARAPDRPSCRLVLVRFTSSGVWRCSGAETTLQTLLAFHFFILY